MSNKWNLIFIQIKWFTWFHLLEVIRTLINVIMPSKKGLFYRNLLYLYTVLHIWCYKNFLTVFLPVLISFCLFISLVMSLTQSILFCLQSTGTSEICMNMPFRLAITMPASTDCGMTSWVAWRILQVFEFLIVKDEWRMFSIKTLGSSTTPSAKAEEMAQGPKSLSSP